jgi:hypothetical protein
MRWHEACNAYVCAARLKRLNSVRRIYAVEAKLAVASPFKASMYGYRDWNEGATAMFVIVFKQHGALNCEQVIYGPFADYMDAEDALGNGSVPLLYGQGGRDWPEPGEDGELEENGHRFIEELVAPTAK